MLASWMALVACKAVLTAHQAAACRSVEFDLQIADDGAFVVSHDPVHGREGHETFADFVAGLKGHRFDFVNVDVKERRLSFGDGALSRALDRDAEAFAALAAQTGTAVFTSPNPARFEELERWTQRRQSGLKVGLELADYTAEDGRRWKLPMTRTDAALMPLAGLASRVYVWWRGIELKYLSVQERTARTMTPKEGLTVFCWTRDPAEGPPPPICRWTEREP